MGQLWSRILEVRHRSGHNSNILECWAQQKRWPLAKVKTGDDMDSTVGQCGRSNADTGSESRPGGTVTPLVSPHCQRVLDGHFHVAAP